MATWDSYTQKATPEDNDTLMIKDTAGGANKRTPFSGVWNWIVNKLTNAVISNLQTNSKSIIPAINELNSKRVLKITGVFASGDIKDLDLLPIDYIGIAYGSALHRPDDSGVAFAVFCLGSEADKTKGQYAYKIATQYPSFHHRYYDYTSNAWTEWKVVFDLNS